MGLRNLDLNNLYMKAFLFQKLLYLGLHLVEGISSYAAALVWGHAHSLGCSWSQEPHCEMDKLSLYLFFIYLSIPALIPCNLFAIWSGVCYAVSGAFNLE